MNGTVALLRKEMEQLRKSKERVLLAIDGPCASGKTTLAQQLAQDYDCNVFHMDDFFLPDLKRTAVRLAEIGGNVDYERFQKEVIEPVKEGKRFEYRSYDCRRKQLCASVLVEPKRLNFVEGAYSMHLFFGHYFDFSVYLTVEEQEQKRRLYERNPQRYQRFLEEWIPMEQRYFTETRISCRCDMTIDTTNFDGKEIFQL